MHGNPAQNRLQSFKVSEWNTSEPLKTVLLDIKIRPTLKPFKTPKL